ncbi:MAG: serine/threonine-protein kinase, partial [Acidobacteriota bacterium]|nr:serine/threonine-protein kinase [Acidobacteriota bacterium]
LRLDRYLQGREARPADDGGELRFRLALFRRIADAVHYAHQRGVIHRDLKPSNIVVTEETTENRGQTSSLSRGDSPLRGQSPLPEVKILDFGLARITEGDIKATVTTEIGVIKGTLPYMSPEQTRGNSADIDLRSDVYALGVVLYEMLSGRLPYDTSGSSLVEAVRVICEQQPRSLRQTLSGARRLDPDVETIVGKALEKDADRRYGSAAALSDDIARYLTSQPILARPPSTMYQLRKFAARNRALVGGVIAVIVVLIVGIIGTGWQAIVATREKARAETEAEKARQVAAFSKSILEGVGPEVALGRDTTLLRVVLDRAVENIDAEGLAGQPEVEAEIRHTVGSVYSSLGEYDLSRPHLNRSLELTREAGGAPSEQEFSSLSSVANLALNEGRYDEAESLYRETVEIAREVHGENHPQTAIALSNVAWALEELGRLDEAEALL